MRPEREILAEIDAVAIRRQQHWQVPGSGDQAVLCTRRLTELWEELREARVGMPAEVRAFRTSPEFTHQQLPWEPFMRTG